MRPDGGQLQYADLRVFGAVARRNFALLDKGMDRPAIIAIYRTRYGEKILSAPTTEGFNLLAWVMPFCAFLSAAVLSC